MPRPKRAAASARAWPIHGSGSSISSEVSANPSESGSIVRRSSAGDRVAIGMVRTQGREADMSGLLLKTRRRQEAGPLRLALQVSGAQLRGIVLQHAEGYRQRLHQRGLD